MRKPRIAISLEPEFAAKIKKTARETGKPESQILADLARIGDKDFDVYRECLAAKNQLRQKQEWLTESQEKVRTLDWELSEAKTNLESTARESVENLDKIATKLDVPADVQDCLERIDALHEDIAKTRYEIVRLLDRGLLARIFNIKPKQVVKKEREGRTWDTPSKPITPTPKK